MLKANGDAHAQNYQINFNFNSAPSDPVSSHVEKILTLENQISKLERNTAPITKLIHDVKENADKASEYSPMKDFPVILDLFYFGGCSLYEVAAELKRSRRTISERRKALVLKAADYLGL